MNGITDKHLGACAIRPELMADLPVRMADLPVHRGYPVPRFVDWIRGEPDFRIMNRDYWNRCVRERICWVCGRRLGAYLAFLAGPMCAVNRTTSEPPCHLECARWSAKHCPFLSKPHMVRREDGLPEERSSIGGIAILRNPGVALVWVTREYRLEPDGMNGWVIRIGEPVDTEWFAEGRPATLAEVKESIRTGMPELAALDPDGLNDLEAAAERLEPWLPKR